MLIVKIFLKRTEHVLYCYDEKWEISHSDKVENDSIV